MKNKLAIVLPAYKPEFLKETLQSIADQNDQHFTLYIGDDDSPFDLKSIVDEFVDSIDLVYHRFEHNLGSRDLVSHWNRCVELSEGEEWIWLFADDDLMESGCVKAFYRCVNESLEYDVLHFDTLIIDQTGRLLKTPKCFPEKLAVRDFFFKRINYQISSFAVEYIVRRSTYERMGGFINFDLAWCADDASWMSFGYLKSIKTIPGVRVRWRKSGLNITTLNSDRFTLHRKVRAQTIYVNWVADFFKKKRIIDITTAYQKARWILDLPFHSEVLELKEKGEVAREVLHAMEVKPSLVRIWLYLGYCEIKCWVKSWLK